MNLNDLYKLAGIQRNDTPAIEPQPVEQVAEQPMDGREDMKAMIALVSPEQLNKLVGNAPVEEEGFANSGDEYAGEPQEFKGTLGSPADLSLRRYLGANGMPVSMDESSVYKDLTTQELSEAYFNYKLDEAPKKAYRDIMPMPGPRGSDYPDLPMPMPDPMPFPDPRDPRPMPTPLPDPGPPNDPTPFPRPPMPDPGPPNDPTPFPRPPEDPTPFPGPKPKDPPGEPIPEPRPEPGPPIPIPGGGPEEPPKPKIGDPDEGWYIEEPGKAEEPKDPIDTKIDPKDLDGDSPADPKDPNWDLKLDALGRNIQTSKEREEMFQKYGLTPPRDVLKAQMKREQDRRDRTNKVGFDKLYNDRDEDTLNSTYVSQRDENGNIIDPNPKESTMNEEPNEGNEFTGALANAKKAGKKDFKVDGKTYKVKESDMDLNRLKQLSGIGQVDEDEYDPNNSQAGMSQWKDGIPDELMMVIKKYDLDPMDAWQMANRDMNADIDAIANLHDEFVDRTGSDSDIDSGEEWLASPEYAKVMTMVNDLCSAMGVKDGGREECGNGLMQYVDEGATTESEEQLHADMNRMRKLSGLTESTIMEKPKNPTFDPFGGAPGDEGDDPEFDPFGGAPGDEGEGDPMGGMGEPGGPANPPAGTRPPDAIGPKPTPPKSDPVFDPFGGAPGDEGDDPEDPMGGMGEPGGPADPPAGTRPPDAIGPKPTPPAAGTRPPDAIGPTPTPPAAGTRPPDAIGPTPTDPKAPATPGDTAEKPKAPAITPGMRADAEAYADRVGLPLNQIGTLVPGTVGGIPTTLEVGPTGTVTDMKTGDIIGGDDADAAREASKGRTSGLGKTPDADTSAPTASTAPKAPTSSGEQKLPNGMTVAQAKRLAKLAGYSEEQIAAYEKRAREQGLIK